MTKLFEEVFSELNKLPENEQNNFAQLIIEELNWEKQNHLMNYEICNHRTI